MFSQILLATDLSPSAGPATELAIELALKFDAQLTLVHVCEIPAYVYAGMGFTPEDLLTPVQEAASAALAAERGRIQKRLPHATSVMRLGDAAQAILEVAEELKASLIVIGTHGRRGAAHLLIGSVAERVVQRASVPVLTVRSRPPT